MLMEVIVETILFDIKLFRSNAIIVRKSSVYILNKKLCPKELFEYLSCDHLVSCLWCQKKELFLCQFGGMCPFLQVLSMFNSILLYIFDQWTCAPLKVE